MSINSKNCSALISLKGSGTFFMDNQAPGCGTLITLPQAMFQFTWLCVTTVIRKFAQSLSLSSACNMLTGDVFPNLSHLNVGIGRLMAA